MFSILTEHPSAKSKLIWPHKVQFLVLKLAKTDFMCAFPLPNITSAFDFYDCDILMLQALFICFCTLDTNA